MIDFATTRYLSSADAVLAGQSASCMLVRVYPVDGIEAPIGLTAAPRLVGRDPQCSLPLRDDSVSRRHAMLEFDGTTHVACDLGSKNGTYVNERRLSGRQPLAAGDRVRFGNQIFKYLSADGIEAQYHDVVFNLMTTDGLTGVHNKRYFLETLEREILQSRRASSPLGVLMMDLDRFKSINDTYGHLAGDAALVEFARRAKSVLRSGELFARYGGEEFVMLMTRTSLDETLTVAERIRQVAASAPVQFESTAIPLTVSIGACHVEGGTEREAAELLAEADKWLYEAKKSGRNQVQFQQGK